MKKRILFALSAILLLGPSLAARDREEMIVLFDTSVSVLPLYEDLTTLVLQGIQENQIQRGDSFHLLSFAEEPVYELSQDVRNEEDLIKIRSYMQVLKPMGLHTDLIMALNFLYSFTRDLSINTRKTILILTDGIHDPPPGSPSYGRGNGYVERSLQEITDKINRQGWNVRILQLDPAGDLIRRNGTPLAAEEDVTPLPREIEETSSTEGVAAAESPEGPAVSESDRVVDAAAKPAPPGEQENYLELMSEELKAPVTPFDRGQEDLASRVMGVARLSFSQDLGEVRRAFNLPLEITNYGSLPVAVNLQGIRWNGVNLLKDKISKEIPPGETRTLKVAIQLPDELKAGPHHLPINFIFADGEKVSPAEGMLNFTLRKAGASRIDPMAFYAGGALLLLAAIIAMAILIRRHLERTADEETYGVSAPVRGAEAPQSAPAADYRSTPDTAAASSSTAVSSERAVEVRRESLPAPAGTGGKAASASHGEKEHKVPLMAVNENHVIVKEHRDVVKAKGLPAIHPQDYPYAIEMKVEGQNPFAGQRNLRVVKENAPKLVGSRGAPFHIFIHPVPPKLAEISYDGKDYTLTPLLEEAFPGLDGPLENCLNRWIPLKAANGKTVRIRFTHWVSPLEKLNRLMHSIDHPGLPPDKF